MSASSFLRPLRGRAGLAARQSGFSLIVSLMMLIVIIILGLSASQISINEERAARNDRDRQIAFQAAEAALKEAEFEILSTLSPACDVPGNPPSRKRTGTSTCFNQGNAVGYVPQCSAPPNEGLCDNTPARPGWMDAHFAADAMGASPVNTTQYGRFTGHVFGSQQTLANPSLPVSKYDPRYVIEIVPNNTSIESQTGDGAGGGAGAGHIFRVTAMGFGANPNSQVVLQTIVATRN